MTPFHPYRWVCTKVCRALCRASVGSAVLVALSLLMGGCGGGGGGGGGGGTPPAKELRFALVAFSVDESGGSIIISVERVGTAAGQVGVDYATVDLAARAPEDYVTDSGTLNWNDGDAADKTFTVIINDDPYGEGDETIALELSNPTGGAALGTPNRAGLTIRDDDPCLSGTPDPGFGAGGTVTSDPGVGWDPTRGVAVDSTFVYLLGMNDFPPVTGDGRWRIEKRGLLDGVLDPGFGTAGIIAIDPSLGDDTPRAMAIDASFLYVVGDDLGITGSQWRMEKRSLSDGALDPGFGAAGVVSNDPSPDLDSPRAITIDGAFIYVCGTDRIPGDSQWRIEKRSLLDGVLDPGFGVGGVVEDNPTANTEVANAIAVDSSFLYVAGRDGGGGNGQWRIEKRGLLDGVLDPAFGTAGMIKTDPSPGLDYPLGIAMDTSSLYVVGLDRIPGDTQWRIEKRDIVDGVLDPGFGTGGEITTNPSSDSDEANGIEIDSLFMYVVGFDESSGLGDTQWRIEKRSLANGSLDSTFGTAGVLAVNPSAGSETAAAIARDSTFLYVIGTDGVPGNWQWRLEKMCR